MQGIRKNDDTIMKAIRASNSGHHAQAARLYQDAGNQIRNPSEKQMLWDAAERSKCIANSD